MVIGCKSSNVSNGNSKWNLQVNKWSKIVNTKMFIGKQKQMMANQTETVQFEAL